MTLLEMETESGMTLEWGQCYLMALALGQLKP